MTEREYQTSLAQAELVNAVLAALEPPTSSWKVEVIADSSGKWCGNAMRYPSFMSACEAAESLKARWTLVRDWRVVVSFDAPNAGEDGRRL